MIAKGNTTDRATYLNTLKEQISGNVNAKLQSGQYAPMNNMMFDTAQMDPPMMFNTSQFIEQLSQQAPDARASNEVIDTVSHFVTTMQDMGDAIPGNVYDTVMDAYFTFGAQNTNGSALALVTAAQSSIDSAMAKGLQSGADVTGLVKLRSQMESGASGNVRGRSVLNDEGVNTNAMADAVTLLLKLPADVQTKISAENVNKAYFDYLTAGKKGKAAAQAKAVEVLFANAQAAIASGKLNASQVQELRGLMAQIDRERSVGENAAHANVDSFNTSKDNVSIKPPNPLRDAKMHTDEGLQKIIEEEGLDVNEFAALLDADRVLAPSEKALVRRVLQKIGKPKKGTLMQKVVPQKDIQSILNGDFGTVRKSVAQASHVSKLRTLAEIYYGLRLDFDDKSFTFNDKTYGRIRYTVKDESSIDYSIDVPGYNYPYTGRGFLGTNRVIVPEYMQVQRKYRFGDVLEIVDSVTGKVLETYVFKNHWVLKGGK
jgi:hypothetical protein